MTIEQAVLARAGGACELCTTATELQVYTVPPDTTSTTDNTIAICGKCRAQIDKREEPDANHWRALTTTMWSEVPGVQVMAWRMLNRLRSESWAAESLDMLYLDEDRLEWAKAMNDHLDEGVQLHKDAYGAVLNQGDTVVLTQSLDVKGSSVNARVGTVIHNIRLVSDNVEQIEGRIENQMIVVLTKYVRKKA